MDELIEAVQLKYNMERLGESGSEIDQGDVPGKKAARRDTLDFYGQRRDQSPSEIEAMQRKVKRILREKDDDAEFFSSKIRQLKRQLKDAMLEKGELAEQVERLENQKQRLERFYKEKMGMTMDGQRTLGQTAGSSGELIGEVSIIQRRIEFLEEQAD